MMRYRKRSLHHSSSPQRLVDLRPERWQRRCAYCVSAWLVATGVLWLLAHYLMRPVAEFGESVHPLEPWSMKLHGAGAMFALFIIGSLLNNHIRRALRARRNLLSGWSMISALVALTISGYALYYIASEQSRPFWSAAHWIAGLVFPLTLIVHIALAERRT
jgi:MFS family permease